MEDGPGEDGSKRKNEEEDSVHERKRVRFDDDPPRGQAPGGEEGPGEPEAPTAHEQQEGEDADVEEDVEEEKTAPAVRVARSPGDPTPREIEEHMVTHMPFRSWCPHCVRGRGVSTPHTSKDKEGDNRVPIVAFDYCFMGAGDAPTTPILVVRCSDTGMTHTMAVCRKGTNEDWVVRRTCRFIEELGHKRIILKCDREHATVDLQNKIVAMSEKEIIPENSVTGDSKSNGLIENAVREVEGMIRTWKDHTEKHADFTIHQGMPLMAWVVDFAGLAISHYKVGKDGRTPVERVRGSRSMNQVVALGEKIMYLPLKRRGGKLRKLDPRYEYGTWLGFHNRTSESLIGTSRG